jgi:hypothetical protein
MLDKRMIYALNSIKQDGVRFHDANQNSAPFKAFELFISGIFYSMFQTSVDLV